MSDRDNSAPDERVTDAEIEAIMEQGEAGLDDLMAAYEPIERQYFAAVQGPVSTVAYSTDTQPL